MGFSSIPGESILERIGGRTLGRFFSFFFMTIFIIIPVLYAITLSIQSGSVQQGFMYIAPKIISPVQTLNQQSLMAIHQKGVYFSSGHLLSDIWHFIKYYWLLLMSLYIIYKWIKILYKVMPFSPFSNNSSAKMTNLTLAIISFIFIQMIFLGFLSTITPGLSYWSAVNLPFMAVYNLFLAFPYFIEKANSLINMSSNYTNLTAPMGTNLTAINETIKTNITDIINYSKSYIIYK